MTDADAGDEPTTVAVRSVVVLALVLAVGACSGDERDAVYAHDIYTCSEVDDGGDTACDDDGVGAECADVDDDPCRFPAEGCPCSTGGQACCTAEVQEGLACLGGQWVWFFGCPCVPDPATQCFHDTLRPGDCPVEAP